MSEQPTREPIPPRRRARHVLTPLLGLAAVAAFIILLSPGVARTDECLRDPTTGYQPTCGGPGPVPTPTPQPPPSQGGGTGSCSGVVVLYEDAYHRGQCWGFSAGQIAYVGDAANDRASSIWVADGYVATLFTEASFGGRSYNTGTSAEPWGWTGVGNDSVSSLVVQFSQLDSTYYKGNSETLAPEQTGVSSTAPAASGCAKVGAGVTHRNVYRRLWRFALLTRFCWNGLTVTSIWEREVVVEIDPIPFPFRLIQGWRYTPLAFQQGEPGHASTVVRADGRFDFCGFRYGCVTTEEPWVRIELYRTGKALCMTSPRTQAFTCERIS